MSAAAPITDNTSDVALLTAMAQEWVAENCTVSYLHAYDRAAAAARCAGMAELGWFGTAVDEKHGGAGLGLAALGQLLSALGRHLVASPLLSSALLAAYALGRSASNARHAQLLERVASGACIGAVALSDAPGAPVTAEATPMGWRLQGVKRFVMDGTYADFILVEASAGETALFLIERAALSVRPLDMIDGRDHARLDLTDVIVPHDARIGDAALCGRLVDLARIGLAAEMIGACERALEITVDYLKVREQFGRKIGTFQALQHRAALMVVDLELARSCVASAWSAADADSADVSELAMLAKFMAGEAMHRASIEIVQMHGGIGMTEEHVAGRYLKWSRVTETLYGNGSRLADRYASLKGY